MKSITLTFKPKRHLGLIAFLFLMFTFQIGNACSCHNGFTLCGLIDHGEDFLFIKTKVLNTIDHTNGRHSVILEVTNNFISEFDLTDTIELIGGYESLCQKSFRYLKPGETKYIGIVLPDQNVIDIDIIPIISTTYWRNAPHYCRTIIFDETETQVVGPISKDFTSYPKELFDQNVMDCQFNIEDIDSVNCPEIKLYPNPVIDSQIFFENIGAKIINNISIYSFDGRLIFRHEDELDDLVLKLPELNENLIMIEYYCGTKKHLEKLFVN